MFKSFTSIRIDTKKTKEEISKALQDELQVLGMATVNSSSMIVVSGNKFSGFGFTTEITGTIRESDGSYLIDMEFKATPDVIAWIIGICFFPVGMALFILPYNAKDEMRRKAEFILNNLKHILEK